MAPITSSACAMSRPSARACSSQDSPSSRVFSIASCFPAPWLAPWQMQ